MFSLQHNQRTKGRTGSAWKQGSAGKVGKCKNNKIKTKGTEKS
jgi:hypothetical protein